jgi:hypothetical protein
MGLNEIRRDKISSGILLRRNEDRLYDESSGRTGGNGNINRVIESTAWGGYRTEFYPTYDYKPVWDAMPGYHP